VITSGEAPAGTEVPVVFRTRSEDPRMDDVEDTWVFITTDQGPTNEPTTVAPTYSLLPSVHHSAIPSVHPSVIPSVTPKNTITEAVAWRIRAHESKVYYGPYLDIYYLGFYSEASCDEDSQVIPDGDAFDSGHDGSRGPETPFQNEGICEGNCWEGWAGTKNDGEFWIGMTFDNLTTVKCIALIQPSQMCHASELTVQALIGNTWKTVWIEEDITQTRDLIQISWDSSLDVPSKSPTDISISSGSPSNIPCSVLNKNKCKKRKGDCLFSRKKKKKEPCSVKENKYNHECKQYEGRKACIAAQYCSYRKKTCSHKCDTSKRGRCKKEREGVDGPEICSYEKFICANKCCGCCKL